MKIKNYAIISLGCGVVSAILHFLQYKLFYDGMYFTNNSVLSFVAIAICFIPLLMGLFGTSKKHKVCFVFIKSNTIINAVISFLGFCLASYTFVTMWLSKSDTVSINTATGFSFEFPFLIATLVLALYFLVNSIIYFSNKELLFRKFKVLDLIPVLWAIILVLYNFIHNSMSILISENVFSILISCSILFPLIAKARLLSRIDEDKTSYKKLILFSGFNFALTFSYCISNLLNYNIEKSNLPSMCPEIQFLCLVLSLSVFCFLSFGKFKKVTFSSKHNYNPKRFVK